MVALLLLLFPAWQAAVVAQNGPADPGRAAWQGMLCRNCHGDNGEGGYGPDLAGRGLSTQQFIMAVRKPWGVMPAYTEGQVSNQQLTDIAMFFASLPKVAEPGAPRWTAAPGAPVGQRIAMQTAGCTNCHGAEIANPRAVLGGEAADVDFPFFAKYVYEHTSIYPEGRMGNFSRDRLPEPVLMEIYKFMKDDLGLRVPVRATLAAGAAASANTTLTLTVENRGTRGKGLTAQGVTVTLVVPEGTSVANTTGAGYQGVRQVTVRRGGQGGQRPVEATVNAAVWRVPSLGAGDTQTYTVTLSGMIPTPPGPAFQGSTVTWDSPPGRKPGGPNLPQKDEVRSDKNDFVAITFPPPGRGRGGPGQQ